MDSSTPPESIPNLRQKFYKEVADEIEEIVGSIARKHFPDRGDSEERFQRSMGFIEAAGNLGILLNRQAAKLEIMDKSWFERPEAVFVCNDERMKGRFAEEYEESEEGFQVDIILRPGFLKYGNDEGKNLEKYAVWIPAMLDLSEKGNFEDVEPEQSPPHLLDGHIAVVEPASTEPAVPLLPQQESPQQNQLYPEAPPQAEAAETEPKSIAHTGPSGKPPKTTAQAGRASSETAGTRRRGVFWGWMKKVPKTLVFVLCSFLLLSLLIKRQNNMYTKLYIGYHYVLRILGYDASKPQQQGKNIMAFQNLESLGNH